MRASASASPLPRWSLAVACAAHAAVLVWAAWVLPWQRMTAFAVVSLLLALWHGAVAVAAVGRSRVLRRLLRLLGFASLLYLAWIAQQVLGSGLYVARIYGSLGKGVAAGLGAFVALTALFTVPIALWAFALTAPLTRPRTLWGWLLGAGLVLLAATGLTWAQAAAVRLPAPPDVARAVAAGLPAWSELPLAPEPPTLFDLRPVRCAKPLAPPHATAIVVYADRQGRPERACLQAPPAELPQAIGARLRAHAARGPVKIDWLTGAHALREHPGLLGPLVDVLALRPGLDGACHAGACLMPWQLLASGAFAAREPTPYIPKMRLGFAVRSVRRALGAKVAGRSRDATVEGLSRVSTESLLIDAAGQLHGLRRMRPRAAPVTAAALRRAARDAEAFVLRAQRPDGTYRYQLDIHRGAAIDDNPSIPRHAGTTLVLCELGSDTPAVRRAAAHALDALARYARAGDGFAALTYAASEPHADLGSSALGLVALTACRSRVGTTHDALIGDLARFLIAAQRADGSFGPGYDLRARRMLPGPTPVFAGGQAIMALSQLERILAAPDAPASALVPPRARVREAVERAMEHTATRYWPSPLREFFFLKENWHCLAARASLSHHRHDGYERFCLDYVGFKARMVLGPEDAVDPELVGGYGFGNIVPPHNGSSAGLGEALGAAVALREARGEDASAERARLRQVIGFLLRQQMRPELCFACRSDAARGFFSGFMVEPAGRIDHVQHPWSALGHGARALGFH